MSSLMGPFKLPIISEVQNPARILAFLVIFFIIAFQAYPLQIFIEFTCQLASAA